MASPTVNFDRGLSEAIASEGFSRGDSIGNRVAQGQTFDQMDPALRQLLAEKARTVTGDRSMLDQKDAQDFIQYGRRQPVAATATTATTPSSTTDPSYRRGLYDTRAAENRGVETPASLSTMTTGGDTAGLLSSIQRYGQPTSSTGGTTDYYSQELARQQSAIDAINARYAQLMDEARQTGQEQQQRVRSISNSAGALYSPRTEAQYSGVDEETAKVLRALTAQQGQEIAAAEGAANERAYNLTRDATTSAETGRQNYINNLLQVYGLMQGDRAAATSKALAEAGLTGSYGGAPTLDFLNYQQGLKNDQFDRYVQESGLTLSRDQLALEREKFLQPQNQFVQLDDGSYGAWDPITGTFKKQGTAQRYSSGGSGGGGSSGSYGSDPYSSRALSDYYARFGKFPSDAGDLDTMTNLYNTLQNQYVSEQGYYGPAYPSASELPNPFEYYYPATEGDSATPSSLSALEAPPGE